MRIDVLVDVKTTIGEGIALNLGRKPTLTLAGVPADQALGLRPSNEVDAGQKMGVSTGGWIAIGLGARRICALSMCAWYMRSSLAAMNAVDRSAYLAIARPIMVRKLGREFKFSIAFLLFAKS